MTVHVSAANAAPEASTVPVWAIALFVLAGLWWLGYFIAVLRTNDVSTERRLYWTGYGGVACFAGLGMLCRGWQFSLLAVAVVGFYVLLWAFLRTPYLKLGGRVYTASEPDRRRDALARGITPRPPAKEDYETTSPAKMWWIVVFFSAMAATGALVHDDDWRRYLGPVMIMLITPMVGVLDGRGRFPIARRQYLQAALAAVAAIPLYGAPVVLYAVGYLVGRQLPVSTAGNTPPRCGSTTPAWLPERARRHRDDR